MAPALVKYDSPFFPLLEMETRERLFWQDLVYDRRELKREMLVHRIRALGDASVCRLVEQLALTDLHAVWSRCLRAWRSALRACAVFESPCSREKLTRPSPRNQRL